ncbi:hypothetical protein QMK33_22650 [Hymenobacter sp. H14-R3]|uniref:hypothetical protein n=1 Tax=Hymenobacter sp. H14-R3 TaxID=3046308 RepID=UPI0024B9961F|nr:hypothetical protein [Hymenobacter sp. H14-R3]MDJ0367951.1 hypothetical protein [Hymenobacter sp. H14-R3]
MTKETILAAVNALPDHVTLDELIERLIFIEKIEEGFAAIEHGESQTHEEVVKLVQSWQK